METDWEQVRKAIQFAHELKAITNDYTLPETFTTAMAENPQAIEKVRETVQELIQLKEQMSSSYKWVKQLFDASENFDQQDLLQVAERFQNCFNQKVLLEEWIDYRNNREACRQIGLTSYLEILEAQRLEADKITPVYLKRFYRLWLDAFMSDFPAVNAFRRKTHEETIAAFKRLDKRQQTIAQSRVKCSLIDHLPDFNSFTSSLDEVGVLKRELNKQRKLLPLRKLFNQIPHLLTTLKPCCMMSPLSVSVFLEARNYEFDLVIFDEASQVCTENAIGAIMRGKQVVIVGDSKQLPPTNFFAATLTDADYATDEEADDTGAYESILDEALNVLPERSLKWHYRSRHEHLIAFSNAKIYNNSLITFPSRHTKVPNFGVEYIHVQEGIYDRAGKRHNLAEARKVADLVFEHFRQYPNRSLGIVTFSEAQQHAIELAIEKRKLANSHYDPFFSEEREEPFFIKNLENVQGDERDTIIFSIGYAKDTNGMMYMNFGPLNRPGGERRLNVAITRAKYNVKLVGSIVPDNIDTSRTTAEGVKLLRQYIQFARDGETALTGEITEPIGVQLDSPFEESVYDFLTAKGYPVATQVGCSGFRIDMAIKHPERQGTFVLGIECDGATYHSSRTARERD
ncbi:MAG: AAA domain-containing protein [Bacteroides sp.]|nr:AAA domain-containing protein [Bacteroides sp.]